jgi:hypothetical protein
MVEGVHPVCDTAGNTMRPIKSTAAFGDRVQEHGRLRLGEKGDKGQPKSLSTWRLTSPDKTALDTLALKYGGTVTKWDEPKAAVQNQWQVTTDSTEIDVLLPEGALSVFYEKWTGAGCERRCDGDDCTLALNGEGDAPVIPCLCATQGHMQCAPKSRLHVILPDVSFKGVWTMTTSSWNAAEELSAMEPMVTAMQGRGILRAKLVLERRSKPGKRFPVPMLVIDATPQELAAGQGTLVGVPVRTEERPALGAGTLEEGGVEALRASDEDRADAHAQRSVPSLSSLDDDIVDAELIENEDPMTDEDKRWEVALDVLEASTNLDRKVLVRGICLSTTEGFGEKIRDLDPSGWLMAVDKAESLSAPGITVTGVATDGRLLIVRTNG